MIYALGVHRFCLKTASYTRLGLARKISFTCLGLLSWLEPVRLGPVRLGDSLQGEILRKGLIENVILMNLLAGLFGQA